jgi:hypothetical protein
VNAFSWRQGVAATARQQVWSSVGLALENPEMGLDCVVAAVKIGWLR